MKNKILSIALIMALVISTFTGLTLAVSAQELPNLFEAYGYQPGFEEHIGPWNSGNADFTRAEDLSHDGDGYVISAANRTSASAGPEIVQTVSKAGTYYYSYYVKAFAATSNFTMGVRFNIGGTEYLGGKTTVKNNTWTLVQGTIDLTAGQTVTLGIYQFDYSASKAYDIIVDEIVFAEITVNNLLENYNYDLENWNSSLTLPTNWSKNGNVTIERSQEAFSGNYSAKISNRVENYSGLRFVRNTALYSGIGVYYYSFYVKCENIDDTVTLAVMPVTYDANNKGTWISTTPTCVINGNNWTKVEGFFEVSSEAITQIELQFSDKGQSPKPNFYLDCYTLAGPDNYQMGENLVDESTTSFGQNAFRTAVTATEGNHFLLVTNRKVSYALPAVSGTYAKTLFDEQGAGEYTLSFDVKALNPSESSTIRASVEIKAKEKNANNQVYAQYLYGSEATATATVTGSEWHHVTATINVPEKVQGTYEINQIAFRAAQTNFNSSTPTELIFDNFCLTKQDYNADVFNTQPVERIPYEDVIRSNRTGIGAIYYQMWFESQDEWWTKSTEQEFWDFCNSNDQNSTQEARSLSVVDYQFHLPFFATINKNITEDQIGTAVRGDVSNGVAEFPEFTQEIWAQEMEYAIEAGVDFMAYLWNEKTREFYTSAYRYHIQTRGLNNRIKMCAILQRDTQDLDAMANAMTEEYWYTINGMPVVYIYGGNSVATNSFVELIRRKLAVAQKVKYGEVGAPAYVIVMGNNTYQSAEEAETLGVDATGWYATAAGSSAATEDEKYTKEIAALKSELDPADKPTTITVVKYSATAKHNLNIMRAVAPIAQKGNISVVPIITLGYNTEPRILNPVSWNSVPANGNKLSNSATSGELPTPSEITEHVLNMLNYNKENAMTFNSNTVLIYAWNEFNEGGWFCPNIKLDTNGNVVEGEVNRDNLDAVKLAITLYREHEAENKTYDVNGNVVKDNIAIPQNNNIVKINVNGNVDELSESMLTVTANNENVNFTINNNDNTIRFNVVQNAQVQIQFNQLGVYTPVSVQYSDVKGKILGTNQCSFIAYGNYTELDVAYDELDDEVKNVNMFYIDATGRRVVYDSFIAGSSLVQKIQNYPKLYNKVFEKYIIGETSYYTAEAAAQAVTGELTEIEVVYIDKPDVALVGYSIAINENMTVAVNGENVNGNVEPFTIATFTADQEKDGETFSYWKDNWGQIVSYERIYTRYVTDNVDIMPVYGEEVEPVAVTIRVADNEEQLVLIAERSLSTDCEILEHGIIIAEYASSYLDLYDVGINDRGRVYIGRKVDDNGSVLNNGTYILTKGDNHSLGGKYSNRGTILSFVAYVRYEDENGEEQIKYSTIRNSNVVKTESTPSIDFDEID